METEIKVNSKGVSRLLLSYPLQLRQRAARMSAATGISQQHIIRAAIDSYVSAWEAENQEAPKSRRGRKPRPDIAVEDLRETYEPVPEAPKAKRTRKAAQS